MTHLQYGTMKYIRKEQPLVDEAIYILPKTMSSLFYNGWVTVNGRNRIVETQEGSAALDLYTHAKMAERSEGGIRTGKIPPSVMRFLKGGGRVVQMSKRHVA